MTLLRCRVPFAPGEALVGYASRLAACNDVKLSEFCRDMAVDLPGLIRGDADPIERVADLTGEDPATLASGAVRHLALARYEVRGETLDKLGLRRRSLVVCPRCLAEDQAVAPLPPQEAARSRLVWGVRGIDTCQTHRVALRHMGDEPAGHDAHDFSKRIAPHLADMPRWADEAIECLPTSCESYLARRFGPMRDRVPLLDAMPFHAARAACLRIGMLSAFGTKRSSHALSPLEWRDAEAAGFDVLCDGEAGLIRVLDRFHSKVVAGRESKEGPQAVLGTFWQWLSRAHVHPAFGTLGDLVAEHAFDNYPLAAGSEVLGRRLDRRRWHSLRSAAIEAGTTTERVRRILHQHGLIPDGREGDPDSLVLVDADEAMAALVPTQGMLGSADVMSALSVNRNTLRELVDAGVIGLGPKPRDRSPVRRQFETRDVEALFARLFEGAADEPSQDQGARSLLECAADLKFPISSIIRLVAEDRTLWRGRRAGERGISALVLRPDEVERRLASVPDAVITFDNLVRALSVPPSAAAALVARGLIASRLVPRPLYARPVRVFDKVEVEGFDAAHASLGTLARRWRCGLAAARCWLEHEGVSPILPTQRDDEAIYRRADVPSEPTLPIVPSREVARRLRMGAGSVATMLDVGLIKSHVVSGTGERVVLASDLAAFDASFASLRGLARERGCDIASMHVWLEAEQVRPVATGEGADDWLFRREDVPTSGPRAGDRPLVLSRFDAMREVGMDPKSFAALMADRKIACRPVPRLPGRKPERVVLRSDVEAFAAEHFTVGVLARERGTTVAATRGWLRRAGLMAPPPLVELGSQVFRRSELPEAEAT